MTISRTNIYIFQVKRGKTFSLYRRISFAVCIDLIALIFLSTWLLSGCKKEPDRWEVAAKQATVVVEKKAEREVPVTKTGTFNRFFPADKTEGTDRVFVTDKPGFAEASYTLNGVEKIRIQFTDKADNQADIDAFKSNSEKLEEFPVKTFGKNKTQMLVANRFQISATSQTLDHMARLEWIKKADLKALSQMKEQP